MKKNILIYLLILFALPVLSAQAQMDKLGQISFENSNAYILKGSYTVVSDIVIDGLSLSTNDLLVITPELKGNKTDDVKTLQPAFIAGSTRATVMEREAMLGNERDYTKLNPISTTIRKRGKQQVIHYMVTIPLEEWMRKSTLIIRGQLYGCAECNKGTGEEVLTKELTFTPKYKAGYIEPEVEPIKNREDQYVATISYRVDKSNIDPQYMGNPAVLEDVNNKVAKILNNPDLTVSDIWVKGYASPEATVAYNKALSERRSNGFADYLISRHGLNRSQLIVSGEGEDWDETKRLIEEDTTVLTPEEKKAVLEIIATVDGKDERDIPLKALNGGTTYQKLLHQIYTKVRRTVYGFSYVVRPFDIEEAKQILKTNPKLLSLNETYLVANSYGVESDEFKKVFETIATIYPNDPVVLINASATDLENGRISSATEKLKKLSQDPRAWNNLAISYALQGETVKAEELFHKAIEAGDPNARHNLNEFNALFDFAKAHPELFQDNNK